MISETGDPAYSSTSTFRYRRDDDRFEQVMAYYWVTQAQLYLRSLGFGTTRARYVEALERLTEIEFDDYLADPDVVLR